MIEAESITADYILCGWNNKVDHHYWVPLGAYQSETEAREAIEPLMGLWSAFKIDHTVYRLGELT
jgi:hypothetical protein